MARLQLNGVETDLDGDGAMPLLWAIRDLAGLPGTKYGCGAGICGACTVHVDGVAVRSCVISLGEVEGASVTTIEGLDPVGDHPVQRAWRELSVPQCGFCQAGQIMHAAAFIAEQPSPSDDDILGAMRDNICRCGCYERIVAAVRLAATGS
jgi:isoquinoline 1-oxidoreductase alpha subunit